MLLILLLGSCNSYSVTIKQFAEMKDESLQHGYMIGVIDGEISHNSPESGFADCALKWLKNDSYASLTSSFKNNLSWMNTSTYIALEVNNACRESIDKTHEATDWRFFTLYKNSVSDTSMRIHVATFDADESIKYNQENCKHAKDLFQGQKMNKEKYWCENGYFKEQTNINE